jgi:plastocyanin
MRKSTPMRRLLATGVCAMFLTSCFSEQPVDIMQPGGDEDCALPLNSPAIGAVGTVVAMRDFRFVTAEVRIPRGGRVTWLNCDPVVVGDHTTTSDNGVWDSGFMAPGAHFSRVFDQPGRFEYHCDPHASFMRGVVIVE